MIIEGNGKKIKIKNIWKSEPRPEMECLYFSELPDFSSGTDIIQLLQVIKL